MMSVNDTIAVVGMSGLFPGALDTSALWANVCAKFDATRNVAPGRWIAGPDAMLRPDPQPDKAYSARCCLLPTFRFEPDGLDLDPGFARSLDPLYHVLLHAGREALRGSSAPKLARERTGVILAAIVLPTDAATALTRDLLGPVLEAGVSGVPPASVPPVTRDRYFSSRVAGLPAAILAKTLRLGGGSFTLDAACASSLYAVKLACDELRAGRTDAMLAGGVSRPDCLFTQVGFSQLRALSPSGRCAPFDRTADGLVVGEGVGILVLKRLADALRDGDTILGVIRGIGLSNDLRGNLLAPDSEGQLRAMRAAYTAAGWSPPDVDLIECHGAGTPVGDATELASLHTLWGETGWARRQCALGSIKSMIGHLLTAAGAAGVIKTLLAFQHAQLPPTIHFQQASSGSALNDGPFRVQTELEPWERRRPGVPRRAAVSAFGFGGINAHLLLEEWDAKLYPSAPAHLPRSSPGSTPSSEGSELKAAGIGRPSSRISHQPPDVAIIGMSACIGRASSLALFEQAVLNGESLIGKRPPRRWKGCDGTLPGLAGLDGCFLDEITLESGVFNIPPLEIPDILAQHLLMLKVAAEAMSDAHLPLRQDRPRTAAVIGIDFDFEATSFHLRWFLERRFPEWRQTRPERLDEPQARQWLADLQQACSPPLTASRTLGALGSMAASRIARAFRFGGPSFVVSAGEASGVRALQIGVRALQAGELDAVLAGAVDLCGDLRRIAAEPAVRPCSPSGAVRPFDRAANGTLPGEGAVAVVLKRLDQALADGDRVYAVVRGIGAASGGGIEAGAPAMEAYQRALERAAQEAGIGPASIGFFEAHGSGIPAEDELEFQALARWRGAERSAWALGSAKAVLGHTGAAAGLASVVKTSLCLYRGVLPAFPCGKGLPPAEAASTGVQFPARALPWPPPTGAGPRRSVVAAMTCDGNCIHVVLESCDPPPATASQPSRVDASDPDLAASVGGRNPIRVPVAGNPIVLPGPPGQNRPIRASLPAAAGSEISELSPPTRIVENLASVSDATAKAHAAFLELSGAMTRRYAEALTLQSRLLDLAAQRDLSAPHDVAATAAPAFTRAQCLEFARGSAAAVLGPDFAEADSFAVRVRLPDEPLMLVDRILEVRGTPGTLGPGRVVTEHDVLPGAWYLDGGRAPVCIAVEAGQADLFLCAYLGIDRVVRGRRTYRLLDATVEFHRELPRPGETIRYEIAIEKFLRQGETYLFLFRFSGTIGGTPLITMTHGCAGFFTREEVQHSGGIILTDEDLRPQPGKRPVDWTDPVALAPGTYDDQALNALRAGDLAGCFGKAFDGVHLPEPLRLAGGRMKLIDRVLQLDPVGGRYGLGRIRAEADIRPDDWFLTCHFVDDMVMPGTLMYECCAHALRVFVQRLGWVTDTPGARYEPVQGMRAALKCRGPVTPQTRHVVYEVDIKELGYGPQPFAVADANMIADDRHIVRFSDMSLQLNGATRTDIENFWRKQRRFATAAQTPTQHPVSYPREHFLEFARGKPSRAFGERYRPFDAGRFIARLPSPPYLFIDRLTAVEPEPWVVKPGGWVESEYDVPPDAWYLSADRCRSVPYCVLLETALQPCGWLAAYMGSALKSAKPLHFRNLGGHGILHREVPPDAGVLRVRTRLSHVSEVTDMIIEHFDFEISNRDGLVYDGSTYFGFFTENALERQEGIRDAAQKAFTPSSDQMAHARSAVLADEAPLTPADPARSPSPSLALPAKALRMIDRIDPFIADAGPEGLGFVRGSKDIDPQEWFFKAHFYQDPVCPGSLGIESFLQLLKFAARERWPQLADSHRFAPATGKSHRWTYRGQILPQNRTVAVEALVSQVTEAPHPALYANGGLMVDGLTIYRMEDFGIALVPV